jgi:[ribosomal protein S5]-alanine N-acetyltransferase
MWSLESPRLLITAWRPEDLPDARRLWGDPLVTQYIDARERLDDAQVAQKLETELTRVQYWKVILKQSGETIGCCGLRPRDVGRHIYEIGFHIMSAHWRHGYASEAAATVIAYAFDVMGVTTLFAGHHPHNAASSAVLRKLGFHYTGDELYPPTGLLHPSYQLHATAPRPTR